MEENKAIQLLQMDGEVLVDSRIVAKGVSVQHENFMQTIYTYQTELEEFGIIRFETGKIKGRGRPEKYALLNRNQIGVATSLTRNTKEVVRFKVDLFKAIDAMEQHILNLQATLAQADITITRLFEMQASHLDLAQISWECGRWHESYDQLQALVNRRGVFSPDRKEELVALLESIDKRVKTIEKGQTASLANYRETRGLLVGYLKAKQQ